MGESSGNGNSASSDSTGGLNVAWRRRPWLVGVGREEGDGDVGLAHCWRRERRGGAGGRCPKVEQPDLVLAHDGSTEMV